MAGKPVLIEYLKNRARPHIYSTGLAPGNCAAACEAIRIIKKDKEATENLWQLHNKFLKGLRQLGIRPYSESFPIVSIRVGTDKDTLFISQRLREAGVFAPAIRPPTVPEGQGRIRFSLTALHNPKHIDLLLDTLSSLKEVLQG